MDCIDSCLEAWPTFLPSVSQMKYATSFVRPPLTHSGKIDPSVSFSPDVLCRCLTRALLSIILQLVRAYFQSHRGVTQPVRAEVISFYLRLSKRCPKLGIWRILCKHMMRNGWMGRCILSNTYLSVV